MEAVLLGPNLVFLTLYDAFPVTGLIWFLELSDCFLFIIVPQE